MRRSLSPFIAACPGRIKRHNFKRKSRLLGVVFAYYYYAMDIYLLLYQPPILTLCKIDDGGSAQAQLTLISFDVKILREGRLMKKLLDNFEEVFCVIVSLFLLTLTFANVLSRYVFHTSMSFSDEVTTNVFVMLCIFGSALAAKRSAHLGLTIVTDNIPRKFAELIASFTCLCAIVFSSVVFYTGVLMVMNNIANEAVSLSLQIPQAIYSSSLPLGMLFVIFRFGQVGVKHFQEFARLSEEDKNGAQTAPKA